MTRVMRAARRSVKRLALRWQSQLRLRVSWLKVFRVIILLWILLSFQKVHRTLTMTRMIPKSKSISKSRWRKSCRNPFRFRANFPNQRLRARQARTLPARTRRPHQKENQQLPILPRSWPRSQSQAVQLWVEKTKNRKFIRLQNLSSSLSMIVYHSTISKPFWRQLIRRGTCESSKNRI